MCHPYNNKRTHRIVPKKVASMRTQKSSIWHYSSFVVIFCIACILNFVPSSTNADSQELIQVADIKGFIKDLKEGIKDLGMLSKALKKLRRRSGKSRKPSATMTSQNRQRPPNGMKVFGRPSSDSTIWDSIQARLTASWVPRRKKRFEVFRRSVGSHRMGKYQRN